MSEAEGDHAALSHDFKRDDNLPMWYGLAVLSNSGLLHQTSSDQTIAPMGVWNQRRRHCALIMPLKTMQPASKPPA